MPGGAAPADDERAGRGCGGGQGVVGAGSVVVSTTTPGGNSTPDGISPGGNTISGDVVGVGPVGAEVVHQDGQPAGGGDGPLDGRGGDGGEDAAVERTRPQDHEVGGRFGSGVAGLHLMGRARGQVGGTDPLGPTLRAPRPRRSCPVRSGSGGLGPGIVRARAPVWRGPATCAASPGSSREAFPRAVGHARVGLD